MRRRVVVWAAAGIAVAGLAALAACSSGGSSGGDRPVPYASPIPTTARAATDNGVSAGAAGGGGGGGASVAGSTPAADAAVPLLDATARIRTADLTVAVRGAGHVAAMADRADEIAERAGGEVDADDRTSGPHARADLRLRVPPEALTTSLRALSALGAERARQVSSTDVSEKVADVTSRVASAREAIVRLRLLYGRATKVADVIAVESELSGREADLESLEAQQRTLSRQTSMATVNLSLVTAAAAPAAKPKHHRGGFVGGLRRGWDGITAAAAWVAAALGTILPFVAVLAALLAALLLGARWARPLRRKT